MPSNEWLGTQVGGRVEGLIYWDSVAFVGGLFHSIVFVELFVDWYYGDMSLVDEISDLREVDWESLAGDPDLLSGDLPVVDFRSPGQVLDELLSEGSSSLCADSALEMVQQAEWVLGCVQAVQHSALARFAQVYPGEFAADELGPAMGWSRQSAYNRLARAEALTRRLAGAMAAMRRGALDYGKASALVELTAPLSDADAATVAGTVLPHADDATLRQFTSRTRTAVTAVDPRGAAERAQHARRDRRVSVTPLPDGVSELYAVLRSEDAAAVSSRIEQKARALRDGTMEQRRADALVALILGDTYTTARGNITVNVTVPAGTLLGADDQPGHISGYGPVPAGIAREIAAGDTTWRRILTDPVSGTVLDYGRTRYSPPRALREHVIARDRTCRFPGCEYPANQGDLDHVRSYDSGGSTSADNLGAFCRHHHRVKHSPGWTVTQPTPGEFHVISPLGRTHTRHPGR